MDQFVIILDSTGLIDWMMYPYIFPKQFLRFRKEDLVNLCGLMRFPQVVSLDNHFIMSGEEDFLRGLFERVESCDGICKD